MHKRNHLQKVRSGETQLLFIACLVEIILRLWGGADGERR